MILHIRHLRKKDTHTRGLCIMNSTHGVAKTIHLRMKDSKRNCEGEGDYAVIILEGMVYT